MSNTPNFFNNFSKNVENLQGQAAELQRQLDELRAQITQAESIKSHFQSLDDNYATPAIEQLTKTVEYLNFLIHHESSDLGYEYGYEFELAVQKVLSNVGQKPTSNDVPLELIGNDDNETEVSEADVIPHQEKVQETSNVVEVVEVPKPKLKPATKVSEGKKELHELDIFQLPRDVTMICKDNKKNQLVQILIQSFSNEGNLSYDDVWATLETKKFHKSIEVNSKMTREMATEKLIYEYVTEYRKTILNKVTSTMPSKVQIAEVIMNILEAIDTKVSTTK